MNHQVILQTACGCTKRVWLNAHRAREIQQGRRYCVSLVSRVASVLDYRDSKPDHIDDSFRYFAWRGKFDGFDNRIPILEEVRP